MTGSGDISPVTSGPGNGYPTSTIESNLVGVFAGLIAIVVVATAFFTSEYRRGLIRITLAANPRRGQVLAAKAAVAGLAAFVVGVVAAIVSIDLGDSKQRNEGLYVLPVSLLTEIRVIAGMAAVLAVIGHARRGPRCPAAPQRDRDHRARRGDRRCRSCCRRSACSRPGSRPGCCGVTPAAGFAVEQSIPHYSQVTEFGRAVDGVYPLPPWAGFAVLCAWAAAGLALALDRAEAARRMSRVLHEPRAESGVDQAAHDLRSGLAAGRRPPPLTIAISLAAEAATRCPARVTCPVDPVKLSLTGIQLGQASSRSSPCWSVGNEYSSGLIRLTLAAMPRRIAGARGQGGDRDRPGPGRGGRRGRRVGAGRAPDPARVTGSPPPGDSRCRRWPAGRRFGPPSGPCSTWG